MRNNRTLFSFIALLVCLAMPSMASAQEYHPGGPVRYAGTIQAIHGVTLTIDTRNQGEQLVKVTDDTQFRSIGGEVQELEDLEIGMKAVVLGNEQGEIVFARILAVATPSQLDDYRRFRGKVISLNHEEESFTLEDRQGQQETFLTTEDTKYQSSGDLLTSFNDIQIGQRLLAVTRVADTENIVLRVLLLPDKAKERPHFDLRVRGQVTAISERQLVVENPAGERVFFKLTDKTRILGIQGEGLQIGDRVLVAGFVDEHGDQIAGLVFARRASTDFGLEISQ